MIIAIDFDGTCVTHDYPFVGSDIGAQKIIKEIIKNGHHIILYTMRSGKELSDAVKWFNENKIPLYGVNVNPTQHEWTESPKCYAQLYIDDAALGIPLITTKHSRAFVDWFEVETMLKEIGVLN
jgi:hydroxymethylpyrimidine pyrophosphatase-like HAD family hydrolase